MESPRDRRYLPTKTSWLGACVIVLLGLCALAVPAGAATVSLSAYAPEGSAYAGPVSTGEALAKNKLYVAEVSGAISYYAQEMYSDPHGPWSIVCGTPLASTEGPLGADAEFIFARPWTSPCPQQLPSHWSNFQLSTAGEDFLHPQALGGPFTTPTAGHEYSFPLVGSGVAPLFRLQDDPDGHPSTADNYGALKIGVRLAVAADCTAGGYTIFGEASEAACLAALPTEPLKSDSSSEGGVAPSSGVLGVTIRSAGKCVSTRSFTIHIQNAKQLGLVSAVVSINGHDRKTLRGKGLTTVIDLRGLPKGTVTVRIIARRRNGQVLHGERVYHTCAATPHSHKHVRL